MIIDLPGTGLATFQAAFAAIAGYLTYCFPKFFANFFWNGLTPFISQRRNPPEKFVKFFRVLGLIEICGSVVSLAVYWILLISGSGVIGYKQPAI